jgi:hypothetical protein
MQYFADFLRNSPFEIVVIYWLNLGIHSPIVSDVARMSEARCGSSVGGLTPDVATLIRATLASMVMNSI